MKEQSRASRAGGAVGPFFRVVLIEDNKWDAQLAQQCLTDAGQTGFRMEWAQRLSDGMARIARGDIDLVLLDLSLPDSRGLATVAKLRSEAPQVPVIVLTGLEDETMGTESIRLGAEDYLMKGRYEANLLVRSMRYAIERHRFQQERRAAMEWKKELDHLREVDRLRTMFVGVASQNLFRPEARGAEEAGSTLESETRPPGSAQNLRRLRELVEQLVEVSQIQDGTASLQREPADLNELAREVAETFHAAAADRDIRLEHFAEGTLPADVDSLRILQVLRILVSNAIRFTRAAGRIIIQTEARNGHVLVHVRDTGVGLSAEETERVFRANVTNRDRPDEAPRGLSLFTARQIVELHGGRLWAHSQGPGQGSTFTFSLPVQPRQ